MGLNCPVSWGGRGADGWAAGDAASCPAMPGGAGAVAGVTSWLGLSAGRELAARPGPVPVEPVRERLGRHLLPGSKQLLFGRVGARRQHVAIGHGTGCVPSPRTTQGDGFCATLPSWEVAGTSSGVLWMPREGEAWMQRCCAVAGHGTSSG